MILFAAHLLSIVYWLNEQPVYSLNEMEDYEYVGSTTSEFL